MPCPERVDRYQVLSEIGRGGMAVVYRARDPQNGRIVAIKELPREFLNERQFRSRFQREIEILISFHHPNMVSIYGYGQYLGQPYLVMPCMGGG
jgi:eukaryotic-like serine/threonine-protein kinase